MTTEILSFPELTSAQRNKFVTYNNNLRRLEGMTIRVLSETTTVPGSPVNGDAYIVFSPSGAWSSFTAKNIAHYYGGAWTQYTRFEGLRVWINDTNKFKVYDGSNWVDCAATSIGTAAFTQGSVLFMGASGVLAQDNANLFYDDTNDRLGLGINASLLARLHTKQLTVGQKGVRHELADNTTAVYELLENSNSIMKIDSTNSSKLITWTYPMTSSQQYRSTLATGTAPLVVASTTKVSNLNCDLLDGADWAAPEALGSTIPAAVSATQMLAFTGGGSSAPDYAFVGDIDTGMYRAGANVLGLSAGNSVRTQLSNSGRFYLIEGDGASRMDARIASDVKTNGAEVSSCQYWGDNSADGAFPYAQFLAKIVSNTAGAETGQLSLETCVSGAFASRMSIYGADVGVGVEAPSFTAGTGLEIQRVSATATLRLDRTTTNAAAVELRAAADKGQLFTIASDAFEIGTNSTVAISIDTSQGVDFPVAATVVSERITRGVVAYKTSDESINNSTTLQDDDNLTVSLAASAKYSFLIYIFINNSAASEGIKLALNGTVGVTQLKAQITIFDDTTNAMAALTRVTSLGSSVATGLGAGDNLATIDGSIETSTAGTLLLQWAQNVSGGGVNTTTVQRSSYFIAERIG